jgi:hypothetical protein
MKTNAKNTSPTELPPIELQTKPILTTEEAAHYMNRAVQTLRIWACKKTGPITPIRMGGPLGWKTSEVRKLVGVKSASYER